MPTAGRAHRPHRGTSRTVRPTATVPGVLRPEVHLLGTVGVLERTGPVTVPPAPVAVVVSARWGDGTSSEHEGRVVAWAPGVVEVRFARGDRAYGVWVDAGDVRRV